MNFKKVSLFLQSITHKQLQHYIIAFLLGVFILSVIIMYLFFSYSQDLVGQSKRLEALASRSNKIIAEHQRLLLERKKLQVLFSKDKDFIDIKVYFEQFYKQQGITPLKGWDTTQKEISPQLTEVLLSATFKGLTMEKLVTILDAFQKKEVVYVKDLTVRSDGDKQISCDILLATALYKQQTE